MNPDPSKAVDLIFDLFVSEISQAQKAGEERERERIVDILNKFELTDDSLYNYYDVEKNPVIAKKMTGAYNAALKEVLEALTPTTAEEAK